MPRPSPPWDDIFPWMAANAATAAQAAEHFGVAAATIRPAAKREAEKPGGGRLAGHPSYAVSKPPTPDAATAAAVYVPVASLLPWGKNPRRNDAAAEKVADSIIRFGFGAPLLARKVNGEIIAGHTRVKAARLLPGRWKDAVAKAQGQTPPGWHPDAVRLATDADPVLPVRYLDLSEGEAHALALADNRTAEASGWDEAMLADVLRGFGTSGVPTTGMGWDDEALMAIVDPVLPTGEEWNNGMSGLPDGDRQPFQQMTFTLHDDQAVVVRRAVDAAKKLGSFAGPNENSNGNALDRVCASFLATLEAADG